MASAHKFLERNGRISKVAWPELFLQDEEETEIGKGSHNSQLCSRLPSFLPAECSQLHLALLGHRGHHDEVERIIRIISALAVWDSQAERKI